MISQHTCNIDFCSESDGSVFFVAGETTVNSSIKMVTLNKLSAYFQKAASVLGITWILSIGNPKNAICVDSSYT